MKRGFMGSSKKELDDSRTIRKSMREASIDTLQAAAIDSANQASNDTIQHVSDCIVHHGTVHFSNVYHGTVHRCNVHHGTVHLMSNDILHPVSTNIVHHSSIDTVHPALINTVHPARSTLFISCRSTLFTTILFITTLFIRTLFIIVLFIRQKVTPPAGRQRWSRYSYLILLRMKFFSSNLSIPLLCVSVPFMNFPTNNQWIISICLRNWYCLSSMKSMKTTTSVNSSHTPLLEMQLIGSRSYHQDLSLPETT